MIKVGERTATVIRQRVSVRDISQMWSGKRASFECHRYCDAGDGWVVKSYRWHGFLGMPKKSEIKDRYRA